MTEVEGNKAIMNKLGYILSHAYSGSTLISMMLGAHSQIVSLGEFQGGSAELVNHPELVETYICSCGTRVLDCPFWNGLADYLQKKGVKNARFPDLGNRFIPGRRMVLFKLINRSLRSGFLENLRLSFLRRFPPGSRFIHKICHNNRLAMEEILRMTKSSVFVDASKNPARLEYLSFTPEWDIYPILLTRDPRGIGLSVLKRKKGDALSAAKTWRRYHLFALRTLKRMKTPYYHIRYEDLCLNPNESMSLLHRYFGLVPEDWPPPSPLPVYHVLGNDMRMNFKGMVRPPARWKEHMASQDRRIIERICGPLIREFGYPGD